MSTTPKAGEDPQWEVWQHLPGPMETSRGDRDRAEDGWAHTHTHTGCDTVGETLTFISKYALTVTSTSRCIFAKAESQWLCPREGSGQ